jgi:hypothetical protein
MYLKIIMPKVVVLLDSSRQFRFATSDLNHLLHAVYVPVVHTL